MCLPIAVRRPDSVLAQGTHAGHEWMVVHNGMAYRCGYVKVEPGHPWYGKDDMDIDGVDVHGGLTYSSPDMACDKGGADNGWWVGFDCAHSCDKPDPTLPGYTDRLSESDWYGSSVKGQGYVESQCRSLCEQARDAGIEKP